MNNDDLIYPEFPPEAKGMDLTTPTKIARAWYYTNILRRIVTLRTNCIVWIWTILTTAASHLWTA